MIAPTDDDYSKIIKEVEKRRNAPIDEEPIFTALSKDIKGQEDVLRGIARRISSRSKLPDRTGPFVNMLFIGSPGIGKTQTALLISRIVKNREAYKIECEKLPATTQELNTRLFGGTQGYQGMTIGEISSQFETNSNRVLLFDEIQRCKANLLDQLLNVLQDGIYRDGFSKKEVRLNNTIIIATANAEYETMVELQETIAKPAERQNAFIKCLANVPQFPEAALRRFHEIFVFKMISDDALARIIVDNANKKAKLYGLNLIEFDREALVELVMEASAQKSIKGATAAMDVVDTHLNWLMEELMSKGTGDTALRLHLTTDGKIAISPTNHAN